MGAEMLSATSLVHAAVGETTRHHVTCMEGSLQHEEGSRWIILPSAIKRSDWLKPPTTRRRRCLLPYTLLRRVVAREQARHAL